MAKARQGGCAGTNATGAPCGMHRLQGSRYCFSHAPEAGRARAEARKLGGQNRRVGLALDPPAEPPHLRDVAAIQGQLEATVFNTLHLENSNGRNRTVGYLLGHALKALEVGELE